MHGDPCMEQILDSELVTDTREARGRDIITMEDQRLYQASGQSCLGDNCMEQILDCHFVTDTRLAPGHDIMGNRRLQYVSTIVPRGSLHGTDPML